MVILLSLPAQLQAQTKVFTADELAQYNGENGTQVYFAYEGVVYDVTGSRFWEEGKHYGLQGGTDLTGQMAGAPHGEEVFKGLKIVGSFATDQTSPVVAASPTTTDSAPAKTADEESTTTQTNKKWYEGRIRIAGISILGWTGILMGVFFVLTFATCFAMPWAKLPLPWKGSRLGRDALDAAPKHMTWSSIHKHFVWWVVILGVIHGVLGLLQMFGWYL